MITRALTLPTAHELLTWAWERHWQRHPKRPLNATQLAQDAAWQSYDWRNALLADHAEWLFARLGVDRLLRLFDAAYGLLACYVPDGQCWEVPDPTDPEELPADIANFVAYVLACARWELVAAERLATITVTVGDATAFLAEPPLRRASGPQLSLFD